MVKKGFTRAYGTSLKRALARGTSNRFKACLSGMAVTSLLQSSTAAILLLISFVKKNAITLAAAIAVVIGADIATTLVAQILVFDLSWISPALLLIGIIGHMKFEHGGRKKHLFSVLIGLGLMLLSLSLIKDASAPLANSETLPLILAPLEVDPIMAILIAALLTWILHSSLAAVLLFASLASNDILHTELALLLVLGANLGSGFIAFITTYAEGVPARRVTLANIIMRLLVILLVYAFLPAIQNLLTQHEDDIARQIVHAHTAFAIVLGMIFLPFTGLIAKLVEKILPQPKDTKPPAHAPVYLDNDALNTPVIALACAARETLRMAEMVQSMLEKTIETFKQNTDSMAKNISQKDQTIDKLYEEIKLYLSRITREPLDPKESDRYYQIMTFSTNLEHIGDIIEKSLMDLAKKKIKKGERFSDEGWKEIKEFHKMVVENMKLAQTIFLSRDPELAQQLVDNKAVVRKIATESSEQHFERLSTGMPETLATSSLHLDIIRDYRRINSYITKVAFSVLENAKMYEKR